MLEGVALPTVAVPPGHRSRRGKRLSLVIPCHNEAEVLPLLFARLDAVLPRLGVECEIVCVNDGSRDETLAGLLLEQSRRPALRVVDLARNFGKERAMTAGIDAATGDFVAPLDADLQDPPELLEAFLAAWEDGADVAYGVRIDRRSDGPLKRWTADAFYRVFNRVGNVDLPPNAGDFRLMDRAVVDALRALPERNRFMKGLFTWVGFNQAAVPYVRPPRAAGASSFGFWKLWNFALDGIVSFSTAPLRIWTYIGLISAAGAILAALGLTVRTLVFGRDVPGYPSMMVMLLLSFGVQMLATGILGEYVGRIYQEVKGRPIYIVRKRYGF